MEKPTISYSVDVVVEDEKSESEKSESLLVKELGLGTLSQSKKSSRPLDVLKVYHPAQNENYSLLYMGDVSWNVGDTLKLALDVRKDFVGVWYDDQLATYLGEDNVMAATPSNKRYHTGVITEVKSIKSPKKD